MPELPEAESIARALNRALRKKKITSVEVYAPKLRTPLAPLKTAGLVGRTFVGCRRRARYAVADLDDGRALTMHFGMSGVVRVEDAAKPHTDCGWCIIEGNPGGESFFQLRVGQGVRDEFKELIGFKFKTPPGFRWDAILRKTGRQGPKL